MEVIFSVSGITEQLRKTLEERFPFVWVRGEVTNYSRAASGHIYFSLKDSHSQLPCVWFANSWKKMEKGRLFDPLTGEVHQTPKPGPAEYMRNGLDLLCAGTIGVYANRGSYQLVVEVAEPAGVGLLAQEFEERKRRLAAMGIFDQERKKTLPANPERIALITSPHGAAIHDFLELARERGISSRIRLYPVPVQGDGAADKICAALALANSQEWAQVAVLIRGGGSLEDLWAFNDERLALAISESDLPVLTGVGHEIDTSIADLAADVRAATPSHAAQILWPARREISQRLDELELALNSAINTILDHAESETRRVSHSLSLLSPARILGERERRNADLRSRMDRNMRAWLEGKSQRLHGLYRAIPASLMIDRLSMATGNLDRLVKDATAAASLKISSWEQKAGSLTQKMEHNAGIMILRQSGKLDALETRLRTGDPLGPLKRGYALLSGESGAIKSISTCRVGEKIRARLLDGVLRMTINETEKRELPDARK